MLEPTADAFLEASRTGTTLSLRAAVDPDHQAVRSAVGDRSYGELDANANRLARALRAAGLGAGDAVALICRNRPEFLETYYACLRTGIRLTPVNWHLTGEEIAYIVGDCDAKAIVAHADLGDRVTTAGAGNDALRVKLAIGGDLPGFAAYGEVLAAHDDSAIDDPSLGRGMLYTSGTTGRPKGVDRDLGAALRAGGYTQSPIYLAILAAAATTPDDVHLCTGPLYHAAPLAFSMSLPLLQGASVVLMDSWDAEEMLRLVDGHGVTHTHVVPTMFHRLLSLPEEVQAKCDMSSLRFVLHGAAPCPVEVKRRMIEWLGPVVWEYYGATEGSATLVSSKEWLARPGTVGKSADDMVRILDADGNELPRDAIGTVYIRSTELLRFRYYKDEEKTAGSFRGDYFTVGDHGYLDDDGWLFLTGRIAELIISGGVNIYPAEVDAVLLEHPAVADVGTIGVPNVEWGEEVKAVVEVHADVAASDALAAELTQWCRDRLAAYKCPRSIAFIDMLPRHDNGKLYRQKLRALFAGA
jgi:long-chain acyl-CoA synthetase